MNKNYIPNKFAVFFIDFALLNISFFVVNYYKRNTFNLTPIYIKLLFVFYIIWIFASLFFKKYKHESYTSYFGGVFLLIKSIILLVYGISLMVVTLSLPGFSRLQIFSTCIVMMFLEVLLFTIYYLINKGKLAPPKKINRILAISKPESSFFLLIIDFLLLTLSFFILNYYKRASFNLSPEYERLFLVLIGLWVFFSFVTSKFNKNNFRDYFYIFAACTKTVILMALTISVAIFAFRMFYYSRLHIFSSLLLLFFLEVILSYLYYRLIIRGDIIKDDEDIDMIKDFFIQKKLPIEMENIKKNNSLPSFIKTIIETHLRLHSSLDKFFRKTIDLSKIKDSETAIMNSNDIYDIKAFENSSLRLLINFHRINDIRLINNYFLGVHKVLANGGYFVGREETIAGYKKKFFEKYSKYYADIMYFVCFILHRIFPKIPGIKRIYFALTKGGNHIISKAEILGRLYFCGFEVLAEQMIEGDLFFIAKKTITPSFNKNPSTSLIIRLKRVGLDGRIIDIYKFRTMFPYSEFLQEYIYQRHKLTVRGKISRDFRITEWGRIMRKYWLDELPILYNWIKGDMKIFGVRPLSMHYLSLYNKNLQEMRKNVKPGIIPPFYSDMPRNFAEIVNSEEKYINNYFEHPFKTQWIYFFKAIKNIIRGARSN